MKTKSPPSQRIFASSWGEIDYLYHKVLYWLYDRQQHIKAKPFAERLERLLEVAPGAPESILGAECRSLIAEVNANLAAAIKWRIKEVERIQKLIEISRGTPGEDVVRSICDWSDLSDRLDLLAILYHDAGDLPQAIETLKKSKQICRAHRLTFGGQALLEDYLAEKKTAARMDGRAAP